MYREDSKWCSWFAIHLELAPTQFECNIERRAQSRYQSKCWVANLVLSKMLIRARKETQNRF